MNKFIVYDAIFIWYLLGIDEVKLQRNIVIIILYRSIYDRNW